MNRKGARPLIFVCVSVSNGELITKMISATSKTEAIDSFKKDFGHSAQEVLGPFLKKRVQIVETAREFKFSNQNKKAIYGDWIVNAWLLDDPENEAYLIFMKRVDGKNVPLPKGIITVPISDLRFI